ncbi:MAG TPA: hypothetical protein ENK31_03630, partial [Nannocystis exedens]|nr:hypothetical protein [Nannocystis exedens]
MQPRPPQSFARTITAFVGRALATLAFLGGITAGSGCMHFQEFEEPIELDTHVDDWRDEIIYQILVDRFADGDDANNFSLDPTGMARYHGGDWRG